MSGTVLGVKDIAVNMSYKVLALSELLFCLGKPKIREKEISDKNKFYSENFVKHCALEMV